MFKFVFLLINSIAVLVYNIILSDGVSVTPKFPTDSKPGSEFVAEVIVNKSNITGFAKLQIELPSGLTAKEIENKGASFSCINGIVKFIWTALPPDEAFVLKFNVIADNTCSGSKDIKGKFSYLINNEKKQQEFGPIQVKFPDQVENITNNTSSKKESPQQQNTTQTNSNQSTASSNTSQEFNPVKKPNEPLSIHRKISKISDDSYKVEVVFFKENILGFAKHTEKIPEGFTAKEQNSSGASFSTNQSFVKFLWASLPDKEELRISYIIQQSATPVAKPSVKGEFIYLDKEETKKVYSDEDEVPVSSAIAETTKSIENNSSSAGTVTNSNDVVSKNNSSSDQKQSDTSNKNNTAVNDSKGNSSAEETVNNTSTKNNTSTLENKKEENTNKNQNSNSAVSANSEKNNSNNIKQNNNNGSASKTGSVNYQVQIGAYKNSVDANKVSSELNISESINSEMHEGFNKFMIGSFGNYKEARNKREVLRSGKAKDAFVTAYNGAKRITVQEALMISSQKWMP
jgi:cell division protein FtsN